MKLNAPAKIALLVLTVLPLIYFALFLAAIATTVSSKGKDDFLFLHFGVFFAVHLAVMVLMMALLAFYIVFLFKTTRVRNDMKALWAVVLFFGGPFAMPVFWYLYLWRAETGSGLPGASA